MHVPCRRCALQSAAHKHLHAVLAQLLAAEHVESAATWQPILEQLSCTAADGLPPAVTAAYEKMDPTHYIKVKRVPDPSARPQSSRLVQGVVFRRNVTHRLMRAHIAQPQVCACVPALYLQHACVVVLP